MSVRKDTDSDSNSGGGWEIVYTGFILILLCFFIMLSSFATMEKSKIAQFVRSFVDAVSVLPSGAGLEQNKEVLAPSKDIVDFKDELARIFKELEDYKANSEWMSQLNIEATEEGLVLRMADSALFEIGSARIAIRARSLLDEIGSILMKTRLSVRIEGHTDNLPISNELYPSNWELSTARAVTVLRYLLAEFPIPASRMSAAGYGQFQPLAPNDTEENLAMAATDRRTENRILRMITAIATQYHLADGLSMSPQLDISKVG